MNRKDLRVVNPRYAGAALDEIARTVFRASPVRQAMKVPRESVPASPQDDRASGDRSG